MPRPEPGQLELTLKHTNPLAAEIANILAAAGAFEALPALPRVVMNVEINGVIAEFQLAAHVQEWFQEGEEIPITTTWRLVSDVRRG